MKTASRILLTLSAVLLLAAAAAAQSPPDWSVIGRTLGRAGKLQDGVYKVAFPRTDLHVRMGRTPVEPAAALGSWIAFREEGSNATTAFRMDDAVTGSDVVADGDLVLAEPEVNGAISALVEHGIEVSAVHNHLSGERPEVLYVRKAGRDLQPERHRGHPQQAGDGEWRGAGVRLPAASRHLDARSDARALDGHGHRHQLPAFARGGWPPPETSS